MKNNEIKQDYYSSIHRLGRWSTLVAIGLMLCVPLFTTLFFKVELNWALVFAAAVQLCIVFIPTQLTEVLSYSPILGSGGTYLAFITGNVMNMKVPAANAGHKLLGVEPHSEEGEVVSVLSIGMSSIVTTLIVFLGIFALAPLMPYLSSPSLQPAFNSIMPALMGAMLLPHLLKNFKLTLVPILLVTLAGIFITKYSTYQGYLMLVVMVCSVAASILLTKNKEKTSVK